MAHFNLTNSYTYVQGEGAEIALIENFCTHKVSRFVSFYKDKDENIIYASKYKYLSPKEKLKYRLTTERKEELYSYFYQNSNSFPTGWLNKICVSLHNNGFKTSFSDKRIISKTVESLKDKLPELRYYQKEAVDLAISKERGIIKHPTGSGKTLVICRLISILNLPTLIIVPNLILLEQTAEFLGRYIGINFVGKVGEGIWSPNRFTVATAQTLWSRIGNKVTTKLLDDTQVLIGDECHHINKNTEHIPNTWYRIAMRCKSAYYRFGFSATPGDENSLQRKLLEGITGGIIHEVSVKSLVEEGYLSDAFIIMKQIDIELGLKFEKIDKKSWRYVYETGILNNDIRNKAISIYANEYASRGKSVLIIVDEVENHADIVKKFIPEAETLVGDDNPQKRDTVLREFRERKKRILISTLLSEGFDFRGLDVVILAGGKRSHKKTAQRVGRALRTSDGKLNAVVIDFFDKDGGFLQKHSVDRRKTYEELGFNIKYIG
jgi:superfamily II DNA or RNA helicase